MIAEIIPEIKTFGTEIFSYAIPENMQSNVLPGSIVTVPFGRRSIRGVVKNIRSLRSVEPSNYLVKSILSVDAKLALPAKYLKVIEWVSSYYLCTMGEALSLFLPPKLKNPRLRKEKNQLPKLSAKFSVLSSDQKKVFEAINSGINTSDKKPALIFGVTGSGKTEIYLHLAKRSIEAGKSVILLVPEIILTPQNIDKFEESFPQDVVVMHSGLSKSERFHCYDDFSNNRKKIIVGPRSALLVPNENIGLIIVDEEQEESYKQEHSPKYDAGTLAEKISQIIGCQLVLGSATPKIESFYKAKTKQYELHQLGSRFGAITMPAAEIVDLKNEIKKENYSAISEKLQEALAMILKHKQQAILFLNRRGMATFVSCRDCGFVASCKNCEVPLIYHLDQSGNYLICHHCEKKYPNYSVCPNCGSLKIKYFGSGVEKVEQDIVERFPKARIKRVDSRVLQNHNDYELFYRDFVGHKFDIVIGTQILAKGFDIPNVALVGVISADVGLHLPYFRAAEKIFRLITQVSGRSGRRDKPGRTIIQTYWPDSAAIRFAAKHDFESFYDLEISKRKEKNYPPFSNIVRVLSEHRNEKTAKEKITELSVELKNQQIDFIGPGPCFFRKLRNKFRYQIIIKSTTWPDAGISELFKKFSSLSWDVDAQDLL